MNSPDTAPGGREKLIDEIAMALHVLPLLADPGPKHAAPPPVDCPDHKPVQHRDMRPPWCPRCGLTEDYQEPTR